MTKEVVTHYSYDVLYGAVSKSPCGVFAEHHDYTTVVDHVTCPKCLKALGYEETTMNSRKIAHALKGSQIGAIVACALSVEMPAPRFTSKAIVTSDGFVQANFVDRDGVSRHGAFIGSMDELQANLQSAISFLRTSIDLTSKDADELTKRVLVDWIAVDYRS